MALPRIVAAVALCAASAPALAQSPGLSPESQQEFRRVYGFTAPATPPRPESAAAPGAPPRPASVAEFRRIFGQNVVRGTVALQSLASPSTINSTLLTEMIPSTDPRKYLALWHQIAVDITAIDHRANLSASPTTFHEQLGPARTARALALIHQAMFEAADAFDHAYESTLPGLPPFATANASQDAAVVEAAYQVITWLYPGLNDTSMSVDPAQVCAISEFSLLTYYRCSMQSIADVPRRDAGIDIGRAIAGRLMNDRSHDGAERPEPVFGQDFIAREAPERADYVFTQWLPDPVSQLKTALGGAWGQVQPFALTSGFQFRPAEDASPIVTVRQLVPTNATDPAGYANLPSYHAIEKWGADARLTPGAAAATPAADSVLIAQFWAYDATANLCAPARLYNQIAAKVLEHIESNPDDGYPNTIDVNSVVGVARFYALVNIALADAAVSAWDAKFHYQFPRPVTYIRAFRDRSGTSDGTKWFPLGAQNTNSDQPFNLTPPFPSYPSGHAVFGGALFGTLRQFLKPTVEFQFSSDEFNGRNKDVFNYVRCSPGDTLTPHNGAFCQPRTFKLDCAERENADSRLFMGVHWVFDADDGIVMGNRVAKQVYGRLMRPIAAGGQVAQPASQMFSVDPAIATARASLTCSGITLPTGWDSTDPTVGFGPLTVVPVSAL